jgi:hypothetical protein
MPRIFFLLFVATNADLLPRTATAQQGYEFEVYDTRVKQPGTIELELNTNFVAAGPKLPDASLLPTRHMLRSSFELGAGLTRWLEGSVYLLGARQANGGPSYVGNRLRLTAVLPATAETPFGLGLTQEIGYARPGFAEDRWTYELSPMMSATWKSLAFVVNPAFERALDATGPHSIEFEPRGKIARNFGDEGSVAVEYYTSLGPLRAFDPRSEQVHQLFASFEKELHERLEFALSYGHGLTASSDRSVIATRIEYNFSR